MNGIIYLVDAADRTRFPEAKKELDELLSDDSLAGVPFVVLGNKIDLMGAASEAEMRAQLGLHITTGKEVRASAHAVHPIRPRPQTRH